MERRKLGNTDMIASVLGFGGSEIGYEGVSPSAAKKLLNSAVDAGVNVFDTAECYVHSEELVGASLAGRRKEYYLFTKCGHARGWGFADWKPASLLKSIERSLKRLKTECVDLIQLHSCSETELRKGDVIDALRQARDRGYARYIGYSGDSHAALYAIECGAFDTLQTSVNIAEQEALELTLPRAVERNIGVIAKRPIANVAWANGSRPPSDSYGYTYWQRLQKLKYDFLNGASKDAVSIALRFALSAPGVHTAIVGTTKPGRFAENAAAMESGPLPKDVFDRIHDRWRETALANWNGQT